MFTSQTSRYRYFSKLLVVGKISRVDRFIIFKMITPGSVISPVAVRERIVFQIIVDSYITAFYTRFQFTQLFHRTLIIYLADIDAGERRHIALSGRKIV